MNGIANIGSQTALPATMVLRLSGDRPVSARGNAAAEEVVLAAVSHPPRIGEVRPIAALLPEVLERYGIGEEAGAGGLSGENSVDLLA